MWTPSLRELTPETSLGFECIEFADWVTSELERLAEERGEPELVELFPRLLEWQRWFLIHALELLPGVDMVFRFRTVLLLVARQNGKTAVMVALILWRLFNDGARTIVGGAQSLDIAQEPWDLVVRIAESVPELASEIEKVRLAAGRQALILDRGERYKIAAANRRGGRGLAGDCVFLDELREHTNWDAWAAVSKTTMARDRAQVYGVSNAGDLNSVVLRYLRSVAVAFIKGEPVEGHAELDDLDLDEAAIGLFEWSAGDDPARPGTPRGIRDRAGWVEANPSLGYTITERAIAAATAEPEWIFRTEVLCQFVNTSTMGPFPAGAWQATSQTTVTRDTARGFAYCVDLSHDRKMAYIAVAFWDTEGRRRVEIAAARAGTDWIIPWLQSSERKVKVQNVALQANGAPISSILPDLLRAGVAVYEWGGPELARWTGGFYDAIRSAVDEEAPQVVLTHGVQPVLDVAANTAAIQPLADGWVISRKKSPEDSAPLMAAIGAHGMLTSGPVVYESAYEEHEMMVV